jgi:GAF domain-containing protein
MVEAAIGAAGCFPLCLREKPIGVMWIYYGEPHHFSQTEVSALQLYVNQAAVAYDNARRVDVLEHLRQAAQKLASVAGVHEVLQQIVESAREVLQADSVVVWSYDVGRKVFLPDELIADGVDTEVLDRYREDEPRPGGTADIVIREGYLAVTDVGAQEYAYLNPPARGLRDEIGVKSFQGIALQVEGEPLGVLYVNYLVQQGFDEEDRSSLEAFAYHAALALKKARLMEQVQKAHDTAGIVAKVTVLEDLRHTLEAVVEGTCSVLGCDAVTLFVYNQAADRLEHPPTMVGVRHRARAASAGKVLRDSIVYDMLRRDDLYIVEKVDQDKRFQQRRFVVDEEIESVVAIPLQVAGQKVGVMFVNYRTQHRFSKAELDDIKLSADQAAVAIRNAQLYEAATSTAEALKAVYDAGQAVTSTLALDQILNRIVEQAHRITGRHGKPAQFSHIGLIEGDKIVFKARYPSDRTPAPKADWDSIDLKRGKPIGITGRAVMTGVSQLVPDVREDDDYIEWDPDTLSELAVPIMLEGQSIGVIDVHHPELDVFEQEDQQCLEFLAAQAAVAIKNARLFWEVDRRALQLATASEVARDATSILNVEELLNHTVELISARFAFYHAGIFLFDEEGEYAVLKAASSEGGHRMLGRGHKLKIGEEGIVGYVAANGQPSVALDVGESKRHFSNPDLPDTRSEIALPIRYHGQLIGVLDVQSTVSGAFTREDATVLQTMADHLGVAIQNAYLYQAVRERARELGALNAVSQSIRCLTSIREVFHQVNQSIAQLADAQMCAILLFDEAEQALVCQLPIFGVPDEIGRRYRIPLAPGSPVRDIWQTQDYWIINGVGQSPLIQALGLENLAEEAGLRDTLLVRLTTGNQDVGVIQASNRSDGRPFTEDDAQLLRILAGQAAAIIENARLYQELQTTKGRVGAMMAVAWMGTVVGAWRHAIGNYVTIIEDLTELIRLDLDGKAPLNKIHERLKEIDEVIEEIRMIPMPPLSTEEGVESVLINQLLEERIGQLQSRRGNYARVKYEMLLEASESASVRASPEWLRRVVDVLVDNAVRAMADSPNRRLRIATRCVDGSLEVAVSDTGSGIAEAVRSMLLQTPIEKPKGVKGAGLGLFLAQAILETYGGSIEVGPTGPKGTTMIIRLPLEP